ncbi:hypothetical protein Vretifemale_12134 [Volvox reticuliferus]|uniref:Uncharacterized protein n=1 Tax=Volvox reticuliferus TaxID=1737510 RepID=A0A8J4CHP0_9CHLO|nr:hypothetical protein Vretifemale_12134 [Volvox reticuliferus]
MCDGPPAALPPPPCRAATAISRCSSSCCSNDVLSARMSCSRDGTALPPLSAKDIIVTTSRICRVASPRASLRLSTQCTNPSNDRAKSPETTSAGGARGSFTAVQPGTPPTPPDISVASLSSPIYDNLIATLPCSNAEGLARAGALTAAFSAAAAAATAAAAAA